MNSNHDQEELDELLSTVNHNEEEKEVPNKIGLDKLSRKKFDFLYKRTAFRAMGEFFKQLFITFVKKHG